MHRVKADLGMMDRTQICHLVRFPAVSVTDLLRVKFLGVEPVAKACRRFIIVTQGFLWIVLRDGPLNLPITNLIFILPP